MPTLGPRARRDKRLLLHASATSNLRAAPETAWRRRAPAAPPVLAALGKVRLRSPASGLGMARPGCIPSLHPCVHSLMRSCSSVPARVLRRSRVRPPPHVVASCVICFSALGVVLCVAPLGSRPAACLRSVPVPRIPIAPAHASLPSHATLALPAACSHGPQIRKTRNHVSFASCHAPACSPPLLCALIRPVLAPVILPAHATLVLPAACSLGPQLQGP